MISAASRLGGPLDLPCSLSSTSASERGTGDRLLKSTTATAAVTRAGPGPRTRLPARRSPPANQPSTHGLALSPLSWPLKSSRRRLGPSESSRAHAFRHKLPRGRPPRHRSLDLQELTGAGMPASTAQGPTPSQTWQRPPTPWQDKHRVGRDRQAGRAGPSLSTHRPLASTEE